MEEIPKKETEQEKFKILKNDNIQTEELLNKIKQFEEEQKIRAEHSTKIYRFYYNLVFKKLSDLVDLVQKKYLNKITHYRGRKIYSNERFPQDKEPKMDEEEKKNYKNGLITFERTTEQREVIDRFYKKTVHHYTRVKKFHVIKGEFEIDNDVVKARAIGLYLMVLSYFDDFFDPEIREFYSDIAPLVYSEWSEFSKNNVNDLLNFDFGIKNDKKKSDTSWKIYIDKTLAKAVLSELRNNFDDPNYETSLEYHSVISKSIIDFFINLILVKNCVITPKASFFGKDELKNKEGGQLIDPIMFDTLKFNRGVVYGTTYSDMIFEGKKGKIGDIYSFCCKSFGFLSYDKRKRVPVNYPNVGFYFLFLRFIVKSNHVKL